MKAEARLNSIITSHAMLIAIATPIPNAITPSQLLHPRENPKRQSRPLLHNIRSFRPVLRARRRIAALSMAIGRTAGHGVIVFFRTEAVQDFGKVVAGTGY